MTAKYEHIATITLDSSASSVTFSSIPQGYRDLELVVNGGVSTTVTAVDIYPNGDTANLSSVNMTGDGSSTSSATRSDLILAVVDSDYLGIIQVMDYSATDKHKTFLVKDSGGGTTKVLRAKAGRWASTSAITSLELNATSPFTINAGTTLDLYGIVGGA